MPFKQWFVFTKISTFGNPFILCFCQFQHTNWVFMGGQAQTEQNKPRFSNLFPHNYSFPKESKFYFFGEIKENPNLELFLKTLRQKNMLNYEEIQIMESNGRYNYIQFNFEQLKINSTFST